MRHVSHSSLSSSAISWLAAARDNYDLCELLLENGANVNARMRNGRTPLHYAAAKGFVRVTALLLRHGANTEIRDARGAHACPAYHIPAFFFERMLTSGSVQARARLPQSGRRSRVTSKSRLCFRRPAPPRRWRSGPTMMTRREQRASLACGALELRRRSTPKSPRSGLQTKRSTSRTGDIGGCPWTR